MSFFENVKTAQDLADEEQQIFNQQEHDWVKSELKNVDLQISLHLTDDRRATSTLESWKRYARDLRDYTSESDGGVVTVNASNRPAVAS
ncbi:hypothetical protein [Plesiomonas shigelloides]|uniref:hypothetical protein n=1 Tax=Plesiomonas shigelloides TaxID=703 RepID=UPI000A110AC6|nr:hypothetical protein [Plesiomonas shigelloides]